MRKRTISTSSEKNYYLAEREKILYDSFLFKRASDRGLLIEIMFLLSEMGAPIGVQIKEAIEAFIASHVVFSESSIGDIEKVVFFFLPFPFQVAALTTDTMVQRRCVP